jgi:hypothetical protein
MTLEEKYILLRLLVEWDPSVVSENTGKFRMSKLDAHLDRLDLPTAKSIVTSLKDHLASYVDDNDFCNNIQWCIPRIKHVSQ